MQQEYKTFGFCSGPHLIVIAAENFVNAQALAIKAGAVTDFALTPVSVDQSWNSTIANEYKANETIH